MILIIKHISIEGPGLIGEYFARKGYEIRTIELEDGEKLPETLDDVEAAVILGGPMNVYEENKYPYLKEEDIFIKKAMSLNIPILGLCLGAQLLSKACNGKVTGSPEREIGFFDITLTDQGMTDPLFKGLEKTVDVFQWHGDMFSIPEGGALLAYNKNCPHQAFRVGERAYGLQFHLEVDENIVADWIKEYLDSSDEKPRLKGEEMLKRCDELKDELRANTEKMCYNFEKIITECKTTNSHES